MQYRVKVIISPEQMRRMSKREGDRNIPLNPRTPKTPPIKPEIRFNQNLNTQNKTKTTFVICNSAE